MILQGLHDPRLPLRQEPISVYLAVRVLQRRTHFDPAILKRQYIGETGLLQVSRAIPPDLEDKTDPVERQFP